MSRFYATIRGKAKTQATREGSEKSGIGGHIRGWDVGIDVEGFVNSEGQDVFKVWLTGGSNAPVFIKEIGEFTVGDLKEKCDARSTI